MRYHNRYGTTTDAADAADPALTIVEIDDWDDRPTESTDGYFAVYTPTGTVYRWSDTAEDWIRNEAYAFEPDRFDHIIGDEANIGVLTGRGWTALVNGSGTAGPVTLSDSKSWFQLAQTVTTDYAYIGTPVTAGQGCYIAGHVRISALTSPNYSSAGFPYFANGTDYYLWHVAYNGLSGGGRWRQTTSPVVVTGSVHTGTATGAFGATYNGTLGAYQEVLILPNNRGAYVWINHAPSPSAAIDGAGAGASATTYLYLGDSASAGSSTTQMRDMLVCKID